MSPEASPPPVAPQASRCFAFERDFVGNWRCIPLCLRRKLDLAGVKLRLSHWLELDPERRGELVAWGDDPAALATMRARIATLTRALADGEARSLPPAQGEPWQKGGLPPPELIQAAALRGHRLDAERWHGMEELERFALCKLARPGHDHHNLPAALEEVLGSGGAD
jgi:hypothetical protein